MRILVTGGCGFIGSAVVRHLVNDTQHEVINVDKMTYAATLGSVQTVAGSDRYLHLETDICNRNTSKKYSTNTGQTQSCTCRRKPGRPF